MSSSSNSMLVDPLVNGAVLVTPSLEYIEPNLLDLSFLLMDGSNGLKPDSPITA